MIDSPPPREPRRRPGRLWLFFYGRKRSGFPGLLAALIVLMLLLALLFRLPRGADLSRYWLLVTIAALALVTAASLALVVIALLRPSRRARPRGRR